MWKIINVHTKQALETSEFCGCIQELNNGKYKSSIWQSKLAMLSTVGITSIDKELLNWIGYFNTNENSRFIYNADIFKIDIGIIYIMNSRRDDHIEAGIITKDPIEGLKELGRFCNAFIAALKKKVDGRKVRYMKLGWYQFSKNDKIDSLVSFYKRFTFPIMIDSELKASSLLQNEQMRKSLTLISKAGLVSEHDLKTKLKNVTAQNLDTLINESLVTTSYIISCRKNSTQLGMMINPAELEELKNLKCAYCARNFKDEQITKSFSISDMGKKMITKSHWMTVWITDILLKHGIDEKSIIWNLSDASEEIDCALQINGRVWIFELKDRNFESGDAQRLGHRAIKFKANKAIVITTGTMSTDAKNVMNDLAGEPFLNDQKWSPFYIEGIDSVETSIQKLINNEIVFDVQQKCKQIGKHSTLDFGPVFFKLFGKYSYEYKGGWVED
jgi:hypothetical protein